MPYPVFVAGFPLTAADLSELQWKEVNQGSDQGVTSSTAYVDSAITFTAVAGARYRYKLVAGYTANTTADAKFMWTVPASGEVTRFAQGVGLSNTITNVHDVDRGAARRLFAANDVTVGGVNSAQTAVYIEDGEIEGGAGGAVTLRFAQNTSNATATTLVASSTLWYIRVE